MNSVLNSSWRRLLASAVMVVAFAVAAPNAAFDNNLWGDKMAKAGDQYKIYGWSPSGEKELAYSSSWSYDKPAGGIQVIDVIDVETLIAHAVANGDAPVNGQGFHFKLALTQDPQKYKTFWVKCEVPGPSVTPPSTPESTPGTLAVTPSTPAAGTPQQVVLGERVSAK